MLVPLCRPLLRETARRRVNSKKLFVKLRTGSDKHHYDRPGKVILSRGIEDVEFINTTDLRLFARRFRINIYVYYDSGYDEQPYYLSLTGTHKGIYRGGIFISSSWWRGHRIVLLYTDVKKKQQPER